MRVSVHSNVDLEFRGQVVVLLLVLGMLRSDFHTMAMFPSQGVMILSFTIHQATAAGQNRSSVLNVKYNLNQTQYTLE